MDWNRSGNTSPVQQERDLQRLPIQGRLPPELRGTLFRNGPNPCFPSDDLHWFGGDGMVHAFTLADGGVAYRNRWVRTASWFEEQQAGRALFKGLGTRRQADGPEPDASGEQPGGTANTSILHHAGRLAALEEGHAPAGLDPVTLETLPGDVWPVGHGPFTAHPKRDPATGALWYFGTNATGAASPMLRVGALDADGHRLTQALIEAPYPALVHDFAVTARHVAIPLFPLIRDPGRAAAGGPLFAWKAGRGCFLGVMRRDDPAATLRWLPVGTCYAFHVMNAWEEADCLLIDLMQCDAPPFFPDLSGRAPPSGPTTLWRWRVDLSRPDASVERTRLSTLPGEFPQIDARLAGSRHRHGFFAAGMQGGGLDTICHRDEASGRETVFCGSAGDALSEPIFVPRAPDAAEADGWLLAVQYRAADDRSTLLVLDTHDIAAGPVASVALPCRVPDGFHGAFVGAPA